MFGLSWDQIILILLAALFLLGPERIPTAMKWAMDSLRKMRTFAAGAQSEMRSQLGPELDELRRQIAELQSLKELKELRELRELDPRRMIGKSILGDEFSGGVKGFLGLTGAGPDAAGPATPADASSAGGPQPSVPVSSDAAASTAGGAAAPMPVVPDVPAAAAAPTESVSDRRDGTPSGGDASPSLSSWGDAT